MSGMQGLVSRHVFHRLNKRVFVGSECHAGTRYQISPRMAFRSAEIVRQNLVAECAAHSIHCQAVSHRGGEGVRWRPIDMRLLVSHRRVAIRAFVLNYGSELRMVDRFGQYRRLPERITRGIRHHARTPVRGRRNIRSCHAGIGAAGGGVA